MAYTQSDLDALDAQIADANLMVQMGDRRVQRRTIDELMKQRAFVEHHLQAATNTARTYPRFQTARFSDA